MPDEAILPCHSGRLAWQNGPFREAGRAMRHNDSACLAGLALVVLHGGLAVLSHCDAVSWPPSCPVAPPRGSVSGRWALLRESGLFTPVGALMAAQAALMMLVVK